MIMIWEDMKAWRRGEVRRRDERGKKLKRGRCYVKKNVLKVEKLMAAGETVEAMRVGFKTGVIAKTELKMTIVRKDGTLEEVGDMATTIME